MAFQRGIPRLGASGKIGEMQLQGGRNYSVRVPMDPTVNREVKGLWKEEFEKALTQDEVSSSNKFEDQVQSNPYLQPRRTLLDK